MSNSLLFICKVPKHGLIVDIVRLDLLACKYIEMNIARFFYCKGQTKWMKVNIVVVCKLLWWLFAIYQSEYMLFNKYVY